MQIIHKYPLSPTGAQEISLPWPHEILHVGLDPQGTLNLWARHDPDDDHRPITIYIIGTGSTIPLLADTYLGTVVTPGLVHHIYTTPIPA